MTRAWQRHDLLAAFDLALPPEMEIDSYWHWLSLPGKGGRPAEGPSLTNYVLRIDNAATLAGFLRWERTQRSPDKAGDTGSEPLVVPGFYFDTLNRTDNEFPLDLIATARPGVLPSLVEAVDRDQSGGPAISDVFAVGAPRHPDVPECATGAGASAHRGDPVPRTIVAIIDTDIAWANVRFRRATTESRIAWYWDMDADCEDGGPVIGREIFARDPSGASGPTIDGFLAAFERDGLVDETALYAAYQDWAYRDLRRRRAIRDRGHGTHVLDCAAGAPLTGPYADDTPIFAVQLPRLAVDETHGVFLSSYVQLALDRIEDLAWRWAEGGPPPRILVNYSFGGSAGRHDGLSQLEQDFDRRLAQKRLAGLSLAAGNSYAENAHARFTGAELAERTRDLTLRIQPDDGTANFLQIWLPHIMPLQNAAKALTLRILPPVGPPLELNMGGEAMVPGTFHELTGRDVLARVYVQLDRWPPDDPGALAHARLKITLAVHHTNQMHDLPGHGPGEPDLAGDWQLALGSTALDPNHEVMVWVERDDRLPGAPRHARQSYLVAGAAPDEDGIRHDGTINDIGTGHRTMVIAGHRRSDHAPAAYSSEGFRPRDGDPVLPTASAPSEEAPALFGIVAAGTYSGSARRLRGTSVSTGLATRLGLRELPAVTGAATVRARVMQRAAMDQSTIAPQPAPPFPPPPQKTRVGAGRLDIRIPGKPPRREP